MKEYPILVTEVPHRGPNRQWTLWDEEHLAECISYFECRTDYQFDGTLEDYMKFVGRDLQQIIYDTVPEDRSRRVTVELHLVIPGDMHSDALDSFICSSLAMHPDGIDVTDIEVYSC